ncbi:XRE family transcriptional regulator [Lachnospiraceae bacterium]|nr:XRE family transcriptional regulator [Lachnospiraceae bacterium]
MNERIRELRKMLGISQSEFAETLNLKQNSISLIEVGKRNPSDRTISDICQKFNVSEEWIRNGTGDVFIKTPSSTIEKLREEFHLDDFTCSFVYEYLKLDEKKRNAVQEFFYNVLNGMDVADRHESEPESSEHKAAVEEAEAEYIKKIYNSAGNTGSTALNSTGDDTKKAAASE